MKLADILTPERTACDVDATSKKRTLEIISELLAHETGLDAAEIFNCLNARERLGSTGLGHGVAIPHGRMRTSEKTLAAFVRARSAVDYDAVDQQPVDLFFALLVPEHSTDEHLAVLGHLAEMFSDEAFRTRLREDCSALDLYAMLTGWTPGA
jgi:PTS system nitrogen regulatory IIA component